MAVGIAAKIGALLFALWGVLHVWVAYEGVVGFTHPTAPVRGWEGLIGGAKCPKDKFPFPLQFEPTPKNKQGGGLMSLAQKHLMFNFCLDVGGYGVLGFLVAYMLWVRGSWLFYLMGGLLIGIADLAFMFLMVYPGEIIEMNAGTVGGPVLWILAMLITPFGLDNFNLDELAPIADTSKGKKH